MRPPPLTEFTITTLRDLTSVEKAFWKQYKQGEAVVSYRHHYAPRDALRAWCSLAPDVATLMQLWDRVQIDHASQADTLLNVCRIMFAFMNGVLIPSMLL